jgi:acyl-CoA synthetase (AMP-forming)/AMP-acid ligase II
VEAVLSRQLASELAAHRDRTALVTATGQLSYRELADRVADIADRLGTERRLVLLAGANTVDAIVGYLAALSAGHPVLLVQADRAESLAAAYDPDVVLRPVDGELEIDERRVITAHDLHPDLALLLSTSGSTGSPKLVRLSHENLLANAESIAAYLDIRTADRAATTLPMHYCYGLSVVNSHLLRGASLIVTDLSVTDPGFWDQFRAARATSFAGVPYTFDLLDQVGFATMRLPHLRYVTQAGGRLAPDRVASYAALGRRDGWDLFVMYGQTEATARIAYVPPDLVAAHPQAIGVPIPGGSIRLHPLPEWSEPDTGELVYSGPNVMLGYAETPADLGLGRTATELHTGDVARRTADGLYEIVGRSSRFAKVLGLRIDPQRVEAALDRRGLVAGCVDAGEELVVGVEGDPDVEHVRRVVAAECRLPVRAVRVHGVPELPRLASGKTDYEAVRQLARAASPPPDRTAPTDLCQLYAEVLGRTDVDEDASFVELGGDSLSYVEMSLRLERALGHLPPDWHTRPIRDLRPLPRRRSTLDTSVALRAVAIVLIVGSHIPNMFNVKGGAHLLLGVAGFNFARFHLSRGSAVNDRSGRYAWASIARIAVPSSIWIALAVVFTVDYGPANVFLLHSVLGPPDGRSEWHFWYIEALVYILVAVTAVLMIPGAYRLVRRYPYGIAMALMAVGLVTRYDLLGFRARGHVPSAVVVFWLFALGWAAAKARGPWQRVGVTVAALATVPGFFGEPLREAVIVAGLAVLIWVPTLPSWAPLGRVAGVLAGASLFIYLTHWQVFPRLDGYPPLLALVASLAVGIGYAAAWSAAVSGAKRLARRAP